MGRTVDFLAQMVLRGLIVEEADIPLVVAPHAVAAEETTALELYTVQWDGKDSGKPGEARVDGANAVYFLTAPGFGACVPPVVPHYEQTGKIFTLTYANIPVLKLSPKDRFDFTNWVAKDGVAYTISAAKGTLTNDESNKKDVYNVAN
jgi:hypothetical protein